MSSRTRPRRSPCRHPVQERKPHLGRELAPGCGGGRLRGHPGRRRRRPGLWRRTSESDITPATAPPRRYWALNRSGSLDRPAHPSIRFDNPAGWRVPRSRPSAWTPGCTAPVLLEPVRVPLARRRPLSPASARLPGRMTRQEIRYGWLLSDVLSLRRGRRAAGHAWSSTPVSRTLATGAARSGCHARSWPSMPQHSGSGAAPGSLAGGPL